jgi:hypothetical protein
LNCAKAFTAYGLALEELGEQLAALALGAGDAGVPH